jgi:hypothetical protein
LITTSESVITLPSIFITVSFLFCAERKRGEKKITAAIMFLNITANLIYKMMEDL